MKTLLLKKVLIGIIAIAGVTGGVTILISSQRSQPVHLGIVQPTKMEVPFDTNEFNVEEGFVYEGKFGTEVTVPVNAFVNKKGEPVSGKVELKVREFHGLKDIFLSGITMQSREGDEVMKSAGMIEVRAFQGYDTLELASGKELDIQLAATGDPDENYSLFYLENDKAWSSPMQFETVKNETKQAKLIEVEKLDLESDSVFEIHTAYEGRPFLKMWKDVKWQLFNCTGELPYTEVNDVIWDYVHVKPLNEERKLFSIEMVSTMHTYKGKMKQYVSKLVARPVLSDLDLAAIQRRGEEIESALAKQVAALFEKERKDAERVKKELKEFKKVRDKEELTLEQRTQEAIAEYEDALRRDKEEYRRQASRAALFSKFKANQMGIFNIDCLKSLEMTDIFCEVKIDGEEIEQQHALTYLILEELGSVVRLQRGELNRFPKREDKCSILFIYEDGRIGQINSQEYAEKISNMSVTESSVVLKGKTLSNEELDRQLGEIGEENVSRWTPKFV